MTRRWILWALGTLAGLLACPAYSDAPGEGTANLQNSDASSQIVSNQAPANPLEKDEEYQGWISAARAAESAKAWNEVEKLVLNIIAREEKALGPVHSEIAGSYGWRAEALKAMRKYEESFRSAKKSYDLYNQIYGDEHAMTITSMSKLASILNIMGRQEEALAMLEKELELRRKVQGKEHPSTVSSMYRLGSTLSDLGRHDQAITTKKQVLQLVRQALGVDHPSSITPMDAIAIDLAKLGRHDEAIVMQKKALELRRRMLGNEHPDTLVSMNNFAFTLSKAGRYEEAIAMHQTAVELRRKVLGDEHPDTLTSISNLALNMSYIGRYKESLKLDKHILALRRQILGNEDPDTLVSMNNIALTMPEVGQLEEALALKVQVLGLSRKLMGYEHPTTLITLNNLAIGLSSLKRYEEAIAMHQTAVELRRKVLGDEHPDTLTSISNLALTLSRLGRHEEALAMDRQVLVTRRKLLGNEHPLTILSLAYIAEALSSLGRLEESLPIEEEVLELRRKVLGEEHPATLESMGNVSNTLFILEREGEALSIKQEVLKLTRKVLGDEHPDTLISMLNLAYMQLTLTDHTREALGYLRKVHKAHLGRMEALSSLGVQGEEQLTRDRVDVEGSSSLLADALWAAARGKAPSSRTASEAFEALQISTAGTSSDAVARSAALRHAAASGVGDEARRRRELAGEWIAIEKQSMEALSSGTNRDTERRKILAGRLNEISSAIRSIDTVLERRAPRYFSIMRQTPLRISETRKLLREDEAVLIISPTSFGTHVIALTGKGTVWKRAAPDAAKITALVNRLRGDLDPAGSATARGPDLSLPGAGSMPSFDRQSAFELYTALIEPVADMLRGSSQVYIVADGALASLPFGVLVTSRPREGEDSSDPDVLRNTAWLADAWPIVQLPSLQSLAYLRTYNRPAIGALASSGFAGFGDPLLGGKPFERGSRTASLPAANVNSLTGTGVTDNGALLMDPERLRRLARLPGTARELEGVRLSLKAPASSLRLAEQMTEGSIRSSNLTDIGILHLATHGLTAAQSGTLAEPGLVFTPPAKATSADDGYLSSSEVIGLDLTNTDWVILSACNTAAASGKDGEAGLSGLARSFFYAGASTLLVSHWPVDDDVAARITTSTINYSAKGMSRAHALQTAMHDVRLSPNPRFAHPSAWAPFSILGDGR